MPEASTSSPSVDPRNPEARLLGTLTAVAIRAKNLPDKSKIGKQDPYCSFIFQGEKKSTKVIKKGGQHPEFDDEVRFQIFEDAEDMLLRKKSSDTPSIVSGAPPPPAKDFMPAPGTSSTVSSLSSKLSVTRTSKKSMILQVWADDSKEPKMVGEAVVDLEEVLKKGEQDDWYALSMKDRYAGEVYLEVTYFINGAPPIKPKIPKPIQRPEYGGPGTHISPSAPPPINRRPVSSISMGSGLSGVGQGMSFSNGNGSQALSQALADPGRNGYGMPHRNGSTGSMRPSQTVGALGVVDDHGRNRRESFGGTSTPVPNYPTPAPSYSHNSSPQAAPLPTSPYNQPPHSYTSPQQYVPPAQQQQQQQYQPPAPLQYEQHHQAPPQQQQYTSPPPTQQAYQGYVQPIPAYHPPQPPPPPTSSDHLAASFSQMTFSASAPPVASQYDAHPSQPPQDQNYPPHPPSHLNHRYSLPTMPSIEAQSSQAPAPWEPPRVRPPTTQVTNTQSSGYPPLEPSRTPRPYSMIIPTSSFPQLAAQAPPPPPPQQQQQQQQPALYPSLLPYHPPPPPPQQDPAPPPIPPRTPIPLQFHPQQQQSQHTYSPPPPTQPSYNQYAPPTPQNHGYVSPQPTYPSNSIPQTQSYYAPPPTSTSYATDLAQAVTNGVMPTVDNRPPLPSTSLPPPPVVPPRPVSAGPRPPSSGHYYPVPSSSFHSSHPSEVAPISGSSLSYDNSYGNGQQPSFVAAAPPPPPLQQNYQQPPPPPPRPSSTYYPENSQQNNQPQPPSLYNENQNQNQNQNQYQQQTQNQSNYNPYRTDSGVGGYQGQENQPQSAPPISSGYGGNVGGGGIGSEYGNGDNMNGGSKRNSLTNYLNSLGTGQQAGGVSGSGSPGYKKPPPPPPLHRYDQSQHESYQATYQPPPYTSPQPPSVQQWQTQTQQPPQLPVAPPVDNWNVPPPALPPSMTSSWNGQVDQGYVNSSTQYR